MSLSPNPSPKISSLDAWAAIEDMRKTRGWQILMERYNKEPDEILTRLMDPELKNEQGFPMPNGVLFTQRDLYAHQLEIFGRIGKVINEFETEAKVELDNKKHPPQKGI